MTRTKDKEFDEDCLVPTFKQSNIWIMVWGCIMKGRKGPLVALEYPGGQGGGMTAARYQEQVLEGVLLDFWKMREEKFYFSRIMQAHTLQRRQLHGLRHMGSDAYLIQPVPLISIQLSTYGTLSRRLSEDLSVLLKLLLSSRMLFIKHGIKLWLVRSICMLKAWRIGFRQ